MWSTTHVTGAHRIPRILPVLLIREMCVRLESLRARGEGRDGEEGEDEDEDERGGREGG